MTVTGECFCGSLKYQINGELGEGRSCHCSRCRKAFSSQASAYAEVSPGTFEWTSGEESLTTYHSGEGFGHQFCSRCSSTLCGIYEGQVHGITLGCVNGDPGVKIGMHIYVGSKAPWEVIPEGVVQYEEGLPDNRQVIIRGMVEKFYGRCSLLTGHSEERFLVMLNGTFVLQQASSVRCSIGSANSANT